MFKEKLGIYTYGEPNEKLFEVSDKKSTKLLIEESGNESDNESNKESDNESDKQLAGKIKECLDKYSDEESDKMFKESTKIKSSNKDESTTNFMIKINSIKY